MKLSILVIDDEDGIRRSLTRILKEEGHTVHTAPNGEEALNFVQKYLSILDVVICDLIMPGIDGIKTIEEINKIHYDSTKIILTGFGTLETSIKAIEAGIDGFITKPFENKELKWKVKEYYLKRRMRQFITPDIFQKLLIEPTHLEPRLSLITILFSDIRGFTRLSSVMSPNELAFILNAHYFQPMSNIVKKHKGMIDKYIGDSVMALFGAPVDNGEHELNAVRCAIEMLDYIRETRPGFDIGIGISTGYVVTGIFGSMLKKEYTAIGMPVNVASRLQKIASGGEIVISEETKNGLKEKIPFKRSGILEITKQSDPVVYYKWMRNGKV
ncbi:MAG TPA: adenylate/guanylate cyclase domain-containing protein [Syntrophorhabdaceae bacterium]|nr:adenylate/guanylate cyclase domain-containing protein [Syntrophorhabdaceae bacterium]HPP06815.1 adenylate/guanylate cyclase domain-containing protein [Syntrophorhabdaceae bacterium]